MITTVVIMRKKNPQQTSAKGLLPPKLPTKVIIFCLSIMWGKTITASPSHITFRRMIYLFDTLLISFLKEAVHLERCSPWVDLSLMSLAAFILLPPLEVEMLRCTPVVSQSSDEKPESDEKALPVTAADSDGPVPMLVEADVSDVSVPGAILDVLPKLHWQGGPSAAALSMLNEENSSPWPESSLLDLDDELVLTC